MDNAAIIERVRAIVEKVVADTDIEPVHQELTGDKRNLTIRIYIDKPGGVTIDDCTTVSREVEEVLDADDFMPAAYMLEVSSPGLERELYSLKDFEKHIGFKAKLKTSEPIAGKKVFIGRIEGVEGDSIVFDDKAAGRVEISYSAVTKANLRVDLEQEFGKKRN